MTNDYSQFMQGAEHPALASFRSLVSQLQARENELDVLEKAVKLKKLEIVDIAEKQLPVLVESIGLGDEMPLANGTKLVIKRNHGASPLAANRDRVWDWLEDNDHGHLIKRTLSVVFGRDDAERIEEMKKRLGEDFVAEDLRKVESQTLSKFVRDAEARGEVIDEDLFGVYRTSVAKITGKPKKHFAGE